MTSIETVVSLFNCPQLPVTYPTTAPEIAIPELDGKTAKMYRYGWCNAYDYCGQYIASELKDEDLTQQ